MRPAPALLIAWEAALSSLFSDLSRALRPARAWRTRAGY